jgi:hypothetical protein
MNDPGNYMCICTDLFEGNHCQDAKGTVNIDIISSLDAVATTVSFSDYQIPSLRFNVRHQQVHATLTSHFKLIYSQKENTFAPSIALMKVYSTNNRTEQPKYYVLYYYPNEKVIDITVNLTSENYCSAIETFNHSTSNSTTAVFFYHKICRTNRNTSRIFTCFHDSNYLCICENDHYRVECFGYSHSIDRCSHCIYNGYCLKGELNDKRDFLCLCPRCYHGQVCQHSNEFMGFTLDSLIFKDTLQNDRLFSGIYMLIVLIIFLFGLFNNLCSCLTFLRQNHENSVSDIIYLLFLL